MMTEKIDSRNFSLTNANINAQNQSMASSPLKDSLFASVGKNTSMGLKH